MQYFFITEYWVFSERLKTKLKETKFEEFICRLDLWNIATRCDQVNYTFSGSSRKMTQVSLVVRTRDEEEHIGEVLKLLREQTITPSEIIIVDNYSSPTRLASFRDNLKKSSRLFSQKKIKLRLVSFPDRDFSHPYSTNLGIFFAKNELVAITNAHSFPISRSWLNDGLRHFGDGQIACVTGYSYPFEKNRLLLKISQCAYYFSERIVLRFNWASTVDCILRRSLWEMYPFDEDLPEIIPEARAYGCEDYDWSKEMETRGFKICVDPLFSVFHSHERGLREAKRNIKNYVTQRTILQTIDKFKRPRRAFTKLESITDLDLSTVDF